MGKRDSHRMFNAIAPIYGLFYRMQKRQFQRIISQIASVLDLSDSKSILDVGCGTGALCSVLSEKGFRVTGIDVADKMLRVARRQDKTNRIQFITGSVLDGLPFEDQAFDISIASYVAHGLLPEERQKLYSEMRRVTREWVIIHDYNAKRAPLTSFIEWLEQGDYFRFIHVAEKELIECIVQHRPCFSEVRVVQVGKRAAWYICRLNNPHNYP